MPTKISGSPPPVAPKRTEAPHAKSPAAAPAAATPTGWKATGATSAAKSAGPAPQPQDIVCPVLGALVAEGKVKLSPDGTMKLEDLRASGKKDLELSGPLRAALTGIGFVANSPLDILHNTVHSEMNAVDLRGGLIKHPGDSAILTGGSFDQQKFDALASHAENGVMTVDSFSKAIAANVQRDLQPGQALDTLVRGKNFAVVEFAGLVATFGKQDPKTGKFGITVEELRGLYQDKKLPKTDGATLIETVKLQAQLTVKVDGALAGAAFKSLATATGLAEKGAQLAEGKGPTSSAAGQAAISAGKAANCPHMSKGGAMPQNPNDVVNRHLD